MATPVRVMVEQGKKRAVASAFDWPGWDRGGKSEVEALEVLETYRPRYASVAELAGHPVECERKIALLRASWKYFDEAGRSSSSSGTARTTCSPTPGRWKTGTCPGSDGGYFISCPRPAPAG